MAVMMGYSRMYLWQHFFRGIWWHYTWDFDNTSCLLSLRFSEEALKENVSGKRSVQILAIIQHDFVWIYWYRPEFLA